MLGFICAGVAVLLASPEFDQLLSLADRIAVIYRGHVAGVLEPDEPLRRHRDLR